MKVKAESLKVGSWKLPDGRTYEVSRAKVDHHAARLKEIFAAGYVLPYCIEHDDAGAPILMSDWEGRKGEFLGCIEGAAAEGDTLQLTLDVPDPKDAKYLRGMRFVSPEIQTNYDLGGRRFAGETITHVAATALPVQFPQDPIQTVSMSRLRLSVAGYTPPVRLGETMADEPKKEGEAAPTATDDGGRLKKVLKALAGVGLVLPDDTTADNLIERLETAALTLEGSSGITTLAEKETAPSASDVSQNPVVMSLTKELLTLKRDDLKRRAQLLLETGRVGKPVRDKLLADLGKVQLSLSPNGGLTPNSVANRIEAYEELEKGSAFPVVDLSNAERPGLPREGRSAPETPSEVNKAMDDIDLMLGRKKKSA